MNDDERFEERLRELALASNAENPTAAWKEEILAVALRPSVSFAPPPPLLYAWVAAWLATLFLVWSAEPVPMPARSAAHGPSAPVSSLFAYHRQILEQLALP